eukprot:scaffold27867_cov120-Isochrysis_galbana.AAC.5
MTHFARHARRCGPWGEDVGCRVGPSHHHPLQRPSSLSDIDWSNSGRHGTSPSGIDLAPGKAPLHVAARQEVRLALQPGPRARRLHAAGADKRCGLAALTRGYCRSGAGTGLCGLSSGGCWVSATVGVSAGRGARHGAALAPSIVYVADAPSVVLHRDGEGDQPHRPQPVVQEPQERHQEAVRAEKGPEAADEGGEPTHRRSAQLCRMWRQCLPRRRRWNALSLAALSRIHYDLTAFHPCHADGSQVHP